MHHKSTTTVNLPQAVIAGLDLKNPIDLEFVGIKKDMTVRFFQSGQCYPFKKLQATYFALILNEFYKDKPAQKFFKVLEKEEGITLTTVRKVELYTYFMWGGLDHKPDIKNGELQPSENFRHIENCPSLAFANKSLKINGAELNTRDLLIIDMSARGCTDYEIADALHITVITLNHHKKNLFTKTGTDCKLSLVSASYKNQILA
ncbi:helix-turn-helix domain-containing protein [Leeuwenhoekiella sp. MAR_2009_132]|uniref:helix-turn-helix domain-containing protein n=1 Tax=Leeuwenhoekiella sp. MAR_2009_132 TaxID=1392489 RepID=UPI000490EA12|nr:helix-turn-helix transcriptional regulator [Leeuwenhoekiella sp. MAR_2009_132]